MQNRTRGFTLVELVMVIAILAIISTFAVGKFGNIQKQAARQVSVANMQNIGRLVESYITVNKGRLNRLDSLINFNTSLQQEDFGNFVKTGLYSGPDSSVPAVLEKNSGLSDGLRNVLCVYGLSLAESKALYDDIGLKYVMRHWRNVSAAPGTGNKGDDGSVVEDASVAMDAELSSCVATTNKAGLVCAAISGMVAEGRSIYRDFGQDLLATSSSAFLNASNVRDEIFATGGPLLAFGLGDSASIVGATQGGIDAAPYSDSIQSKYYRQYILLVRLRHSGSSVSAEFAGVIDPEGNTIRAARQLLK